jgi:hypothetical protein
MLTLTVDRSQKVLNVAIGGALTDGAMSDIEAAIRAFLKVEGPHRRIMDLSAVTSIDIEHALLVSRATNVPVPLSETPARIYVAPTEYLYGMCRMFTSYQASHGAPPTRVVRSLAEAQALFDLRAPSFEPAYREAA